MTEPQVPRLPDLMVPAIEALLASAAGGAARVTLERHANFGRFGDILRGWRGQAAMTRARLTREIVARRLLPVNEGRALRDVLASEYFASLDETVVTAVGEVRLQRVKIDDSSSSSNVFLGGIIRQGSQFSRREKTTQMAYPVASYVSTVDVPCGSDADSTQASAGRYRHVQDAVVPVSATGPGDPSNTPLMAGFSEGVDVGQLFDTRQPIDERFSAPADGLRGVQTAGGVTAVTDAQLLQFGKAMAQGIHGANTAAALAGALSLAGVRHAVALMDYDHAVLRLYCADVSWATSAPYRAAIQQSLHDNSWVGFGARIGVYPVFNLPITVTATVILRSSNYDNARASIEKAVLEKLTAYFDERPDWYSFRLRAIGGVIASADPRILTCVSGVQGPKVYSRPLFNEPIAEPSVGVVRVASDVTHYSLRGITLSYQVPGA